MLSRCLCTEKWSESGDVVYRYEGKQRKLKKAQVISGVSSGQRFLMDWCAGRIGSNQEQQFRNLIFQSSTTSNKRKPHLPVGKFLAIIPS